MGLALLGIKKNWKKKKQTFFSENMMQSSAVFFMLGKSCGVVSETNSVNNFIVISLYLHVFTFSFVNLSVDPPDRVENLIFDNC